MTALVWWLVALAALYGVARWAHRRFLAARFVTFFGGPLNGVSIRVRRDEPDAVIGARLAAEHGRLVEQTVGPGSYRYQRIGDVALYIGRWPTNRETQEAA